MRILLINDHHEMKGGAEKYFWQLFKALQSESSCEVYALTFGKISSQEKNIITLTEPKTLFQQWMLRTFRNHKLMRDIRQIVANIKPDIIHLHNVKRVAPSLLAVCKDYPYIHTAHDFGLICPTAQNIHRDGRVCETGFSSKCLLDHRQCSLFKYLSLLPSFYQRRKLLTSAKYILAPSPLLRDYLQEIGLRQSIYFPPFKPEKNAYTTSLGDYFLFAGQLAHHKGVMLLLNEFKKACKEDNTLRLQIAGEGPLEKKIKQFIVEHQLINQIQLLGWQDNLNSVMANCRAFIFPSIGMESFGLVMLEAMSFKKPVIAINQGTSRFLIEDEENGLLFDRQQHGDLAKKILRLHQNELLVKQLGTSAYQTYQTFPEKTDLTCKLLKLYQRCQQTA